MAEALPPHLWGAWYQVESLAQQATEAMPPVILTLRAEMSPAPWAWELEDLFFPEEKEKEDEEEQKVGGHRTLGLEP